MSVRVMSLVWAMDLPDSEKIVLLALADCANDEGHCWPGMATLTRKCSKSDRTIQTAIRTLCAKGHLTRREVPGKGCNYTVHPIVRMADPRSGCTPEETSPPKPLPQTPEAVSGKPSRTINSEAKASSERVLNHYSSVAKKHGFTPIRVLNAARKQSLAARIREVGEAAVIEAIDRAPRSKFLMGKTERRFKFDFDFLLQPKSLARILEGYYEDDAAPTRRQLTAEDHRTNARWFDEKGMADNARESRRLAEIAEGLLRQARAA